MKDTMKDKQGTMMGNKNMAMCPMHERMMGSMISPSIIATGDGGLVVMAGNKLSKYDKDLSLVKDVEFKMDMGLAGPAGSATGTAGAGLPGAVGQRYPSGPAGIRGQTEAMDVAGDVQRGRTGETGSAGLAGAQGFRGNTGERDASTIRSTGTMDPIGRVGSRSVRGDMGDKGSTLADPNGRDGQRSLASTQGTARETGTQGRTIAGGVGSTGPAREKMAMNPIHEIQMGSMMAKTIIATGDGAFVVMAGNKLSKYDKDLNLLKDVQVKMDMDGMQNKFSQMMEQCPMCKSMKQGDSVMAQGSMD